MTWLPKTGTETDRLLRHLPLTESATSLVEKEALEILAQCGDPALDLADNAGLAFGYVQSGKTINFTTVSALARDNGYRIIILIAGISKNLLEQSTARVIQDLQIEGSGSDAWALLKNPSGSSDNRRIRSILEQWDDPMMVSDQKQSLFITVMKNTSHLRNLVSLFTELDLSRAPTIIIDDEADQASLNTKARKNQLDGITRELQDALIHSSTINRRIDELRQALPHHSILQYTATPQANLFINLVDRLSPNFAYVLTPGTGYTGGTTFFRNQPALVQTIPVDDIPSDQNILDHAPNTLTEAAIIFFLGACVGAYRKKSDKEVTRNRTMMVHPSRLQQDQTIYFRWIKGIQSSLLEDLSSTDENTVLAVLKQVKTLYFSLAETQPGLPLFDQLITESKRGDRLYSIIKKTRIEEVNSRIGKTPSINWTEDYSWILVGGQVLDRGFTVEGLTVTYMPRSVGVGNVDTVQQRARFIGYKLKYLGLCRVYLSASVRSAYEDYINHEEDLRLSLKMFTEQSDNLDDYSRKVILDRAYNLARNSIFDLTIDRTALPNTWVSTIAPHASLKRSIDNLEIWNNFYEERKSLFSTIANSSRYTPDQSHEVAIIPIKILEEFLLRKLVFVDSTDHTNFYELMAIMKLITTPDTSFSASVYFMGAGRVRTRKLNLDGTISNLFQGANKSTDYPGDRRIENPSHLSIQIRILDVDDPESALVVRTLAVSWKKPLALNTSLVEQGDPLVPRTRNT